MKKIMIALAAAVSLGLFAGETNAQPPQMPKSGGLLQANAWGAPGPVASPYGMQPYGPPPSAEKKGDRYGLHPVLKRLFHIRDTGCNNGNCGGPGAYGPYGPYGPMPMNPATGGTLAFPQHPSVRSPRDFFEK